MRQMCSLLGNYLGFSENILMTVPCRFTHGLEVAIDKKTCSWNILQTLAKYLWEDSFLKNVKIRGI